MVKEKGQVSEFKGLGLSGNKRIYGPDRCSVASNVIVSNKLLNSRNGLHALATQRESMTGANGLKYFKASESANAALLIFTNTSSGNVGVAIYRDRRLPGRT